MKQVYLKRGKEESLLRFHPWVFSGAIHHLDDGIEEGDVVRVVSEKGVFIAVGHYQQGSISVRVLTFNDVEIDDAFWHSRIQSALNMRQDIGLANSSNTNAFRLVHGEGDNVAYIPALAFPSLFYCIGNLFLVFVVADDIVALFRDALRNCGVSVGQ